MTTPLHSTLKRALCIDGRDYVVPDDVKALVLPTFRHRVILSPAAEIDNRKIDDILLAITDTIEAPR